MGNGLAGAERDWCQDPPRRDPIPSFALCSLSTWLPKQLAAGSSGLLSLSAPRKERFAFI